MSGVTVEVTYLSGGVFLAVTSDNTVIATLRRLTSEGKLTDLEISAHARGFQFKLGTVLKHLVANRSRESAELSIQRYLRDQCA